MHIIIICHADCYTQTSNCDDDGITDVRADLTSIDECCGANNDDVGVSFRNPLDGTCYNCGSEYIFKDTHLN